MKKQTNNKSSQSGSNIVVNRHNLRGANGRYIAKDSVPVKGVKVSKASKANVAIKSGSSFIAKLIIDSDLVNVVMSRNPKIVYSYKLKKSGLSAISKVIASGGSLGEAYNKYIKGNEVSRTIYK